VLSAVSRVPLTGGSEMPQVRVGDASGMALGATARAILVASLRKALEAVSLKTRDVTLVVPDAAVRVLLLDFDTLPASPAEALSVVRFRLKKLLPFDADAAAVSFQVMATTRDNMQVLAVAMPAELQAEYESLVREAGFEPGALLPSTLAALAGKGESGMASLVVNAGRDAVTTAIVKSGVLLLHRTVDLSAGVALDEEEWARVKPTAPDTSISAIAARMTAASAPVPEPALVEVIAEGSILAPANEVAQAVSVASAYFEDILEAGPPVVFAAGPMGAGALTAVLDEAHVGPVAVQEIVDRQMLGVGAETGFLAGGIPLGWLAGVRGALSN
jgi:type IV pilus assembly protein PilM